MKRRAAVVAAAAFMLGAGSASAQALLDAVRARVSASMAALHKHSYIKAIDGIHAYGRPADLAAISYADTLLGIVRESGFPPDRLTLEVTEQVLLSDIHAAAKTLERIAAEGIRVALDDFGAGFCNFRYLKLLPLHYLKLDRSMVDGIADDARDLEVLRAIVAMARALSLKVIAEGIEDESQRDLIVREGCDFYQGFLRAQPMSEEEFLALAAGR